VDNPQGESTQNCDLARQKLRSLLFLRSVMSRGRGFRSTHQSLRTDRTQVSSLEITLVEGNFRLLLSVPFRELGSDS
jgi:hypothetical protein